MSQIDSWLLKYMPGLTRIWCVHLVPLALIAGAAWFFGRKRATLNGWDICIAFIPLAVWAGVLFPDETGKSVINIFVEPLAIGAFAGVMQVVRVAVGRTVGEKWTAFLALLTTCLAAIALWAFVPEIPFDFPVPD